MSGCQDGLSPNTVEDPIINLREVASDFYFIKTNCGWSVRHFENDLHLAVKCAYVLTWLLNLTSVSDR